MFEAGEGSSALVFKKPRQHPDPTGLYEHMFARHFVLTLGQTRTERKARIFPALYDGGGKGYHWQNILSVG